ncbi:hypothetical protein ACFV0T_01175 [Streptomyces sp. NPDC059582]|uniref:hypothetical protein n=1 Tax=Streptomyces sp. NPDC059582 TaxID=3346875 RepID=UPI0036AA8720
MDQRSEELLDQIVFRWEGNRGRTGTGITAVAYSCEPERAEELRAELAPLLRVEGSEQPSQVRYVRASGEVVLVNRRSGPDAHGRTSTQSHALVGARNVLKARFCLTLNRLDPPVVSGTGPRSLRQVTDGELREAAGREWQWFTTQVRTVAEALAAVTAQLLRTPDHLMSVRIPDFSRDGTNGTPLLVWGLCGIFGDWLGRDFWTYATYDTSDTNGLRVVGVPAWRSSAAVNARLERIALDNAPQDEAQRIAQELVGLFLSDPDKARDLRRLFLCFPRGAAVPPPERLRTLRRLLDQTYGPVMHGTGATAVQSASRTDRYGNVQHLLPAADEPRTGVGSDGSGGSVESGGSRAAVGSGGFGGTGLREDEPHGDPLREHRTPALRPPAPGVPTPATPTHENAVDQPVAHERSAGRHVVPTGDLTRTGAGSPPSTAHVSTPVPVPVPVPEPEADPEPAHGPSATTRRPTTDASLRQPDHGPSVDRPQRWPTENQLSRYGPPRSYRPEHSLPETEGQRLDRRLSRRVKARGSLPLLPTGVQRVARRLTFARWRYDRRSASSAGIDRLPDWELLDRLARQDVSREEADPLLGALAARAGWRTLREADIVCRRVLKQDLYLRRPTLRDGEQDEQELRLRADTAVWLLHWAVLPYVGHPGVADELVRLLRSLHENPGPMERRFLDRLVFDSPYGVPDLPSLAWSDLLHHQRAVPNPAPLPEPLQEPPAPADDPGPPPGDGHRAHPSDDRWRIGFLGMTCVAALLFLFLLIAWT